MGNSIFATDNVLGVRFAAGCCHSNPNHCGPMNGTGGGNWQRKKFKRVVTGGDKMLNDGMDGEHFGYYYFANYTSIDFDILIPELSRLIVSGFERISKSIYKILEGIISCAFFCLKWGCFSLEERPPWLLICLPKARPLEVDYL